MNLPARNGRSATPRTALAAIALIAILASCTQEKKVVYSNSFLGGVAGAQTRSPDIGRDGKTLGGEALNTKTIVDNPDGSKTLYARTPKQLMNHIIYTLRENNAELFATQVLSKATREQYTARGADPKEAFATLKARQADLMKLFKAMPMADQTPGVFIQRAPGGIKRMMAEQRIAQDLKWKGLDMAFEKGNYKLVWFVGE